MMTFLFLLCTPCLAENQAALAQAADQAAGVAKEGFFMSDNLTTIIVALITFIAGLLVNRQGRAQFFSTTVSKERMVWIKEMRALCAELCAICEQHDTAASMTPEQEAAFLKARSGMLLHLNPPGDQYPSDGKLIELLSPQDFTTVKRNVPQIRKTLISICKNEWDKVKIEAGNGRWKVRKIEKMMNERLKQESPDDEPEA